MMDKLSFKIVFAFFGIWAFFAGSLGAQPSITPLVSYNSTDAVSERLNVRADKTRAMAWVTTDRFKEFFLRPQNKKWPAPKDGDLFVELTYLDAEYGRINAELEMQDGKKIKPARFTQIMMLKTGQIKTAFFRFAEVPDGDIKNLKINIQRNNNPALAIIKASVCESPAPFKDEYFNWLLKETWRRPYDGPVVAPANNNTLEGKVMCGYQGWFTTPNDPLDMGWFHWGGIPNGEYSIEGWPYQKDYPSNVLEKAHEVKTVSGKPAYLFSSARPEVVITHFRWMQKYNIDGVFLQRFLSTGTYAYNKREEWVMGNVREAANRTGRIWAVEYDVSGTKAEDRYIWSIGYDVSGGIEENVYEKISTDWKWLINEFGMKEDKSYARVADKLVCFIWGMELRNLPIPDCDRIVNFLKNDPKYGNSYVIGGMSGGWRNKPQWHDHLKKHDSLLIWQSGRYEEDISDFKRLLPGVEYYAHVHPGFSWANLKHIQTNSYEAYTDRKDGEFYEERIKGATKAGSKMIFVGMLDEYDEATQILPLSDDPPNPPKRQGAVVFFTRPKDGEHKPPFNHKDEVYMKFDGAAPHKSVSDKNYFMNWEASILIPADGEYKFWIEGPEGDSYKFISDRKELIKEAGIDPAFPPRQAVVKLKKDFLFPIKIEYDHKDKNGEMKLMWEGPRIKAQQVPAKQQFDAWGRFITNNGKSPFLYFEITAKAKELMKPNLTK